MSRHFVLENGRRIQKKFKIAKAHIESKYLKGVDLDTQEVYNDALIEIIEELDDLFRQQSALFLFDKFKTLPGIIKNILYLIRGHNDPSILSPKVDNRSATFRILRRLERQIIAVCILADISELGPAANADEARVLSRAYLLMERLYEMASQQD